MRKQQGRDQIREHRNANPNENDIVHCSALFRTSYSGTSSQTSGIGAEGQPSMSLTDSAGLERTER